MTLPIIIAGAGPCGLVAALTFEKHGIPYVIYEKTTTEKLCSNAGSGIDMATTAIEILDDHLGLDGKNNWMSPYEIMYISDMKGKQIALWDMPSLKLKKGSESLRFGTANRARLQHTLLDALNLKDDDGNIKNDDNRLKCCISVVGYQNNENFVRVELNDGTKVDASALLACDGIHSAVRKCMYKDVDDSLNYCGQECWWGKTTVKPGSDLDIELKRLPSSSVAVIGTNKMPGVFFSDEVAPNEHAWGYVRANKTPPNARATNDLTRRGGSVLTAEEKKREIDEVVANRSRVLQLMMQEPSADEITRAGFFDRKNLDLSYIDGRVALLGDAAHPQSPMMGQGANMAIVDGYVAASRLSAAMKGTNGSISVKQALLDYDCKDRRKENNIVIKKARKYGNWASSKDRLPCFLMKLSMKYMPPSMLVSEIRSGDKSNKKFVLAMRRDLQL